MELTEKDAKRAAMVLLIIALAVLAFLIVKPVIMSILGGLLLAYIFFPVYTRVCKIVKSRNLSAAIVSIIVLLLIAIPLWLLTPMIIQQSFDLFKITQEVDTAGVLTKILPTVSEQTISQISISINNALSKITTAILNYFIDFVMNFATMLLHLFITAFVFYFALRDNQPLRDFVSDLSPLNKSQEESLKKQFKAMTQSIINGQFVAGILQGIFAGIGFLVFGIPNALILTITSVIVGIIPIIGLGLVYIPVTLYLLLTGKTLIAVIYLLYNVLIVSSVDNFLKAHLVSRKTNLSQAVVLVGMIGGLFVFGVLGLILGPLILAYFLTFLEAYRKKTLSSFFAN